MASLHGAQWEGLSDDTWFSKAMVFTKSSGWQLLTSLVSREYAETMEAYLQSLRKDHMANTSEHYKKIDIEGEYSITPVAHQLLRMGFLLGAVQFSHKTSGVRLMVFGIDCDRYNDYGIGRSAASMTKDEFLDEFEAAAKAHLGHSHFALLVDLPK